METKAGSHLEDIDIEITLRSSKADVTLLSKIMQVIVTSASSSLDVDIALIESDVNIKSVQHKRLTVIVNKLQI